jgi:hypothetical protein
LFHVTITSPHADPSLSLRSVFLPHPQPVFLP